jgi:hypothetical protein
MSATLADDRDRADGTEGKAETYGRAHGEGQSILDIRFRESGVPRAFGEDPSAVPANLKNVKLNDRTQFGLASVIFKRDYLRWI